MEQIKTITDIDDAIEAMAAFIIDLDTVAIWDVGEKLWGVYSKQKGSLLWELQMTAVDIQPFLSSDELE